MIVESDGVLRMGDKLCVPDVDGLRHSILEEAHNSKYIIQPESTKMYHDLKQFYWWEGMKKDVANFVSCCLTCQQVKAEHQRPARLLQQIEIPEWKWERITMDFVTSLPRTLRVYDSVWVIVDRLTKSAHLLPVKTTYGGVRYAQIFMNEIVRFHGVPTDEQSEHTIQILEDTLRACIFEFGVFHVSMLRKCISDSSQVLEAPAIPLDEKLSYEEEPIAIADRQVRKLQSKEILFVKFLWRNHTVEEATWEMEDDMRVKYPYLFQSTGNGEERLKAVADLTANLQDTINEVNGEDEENVTPKCFPQTKWFTSSSWQRYHLPWKRSLYVHNGKKHHQQ
ncbi:uncharacterized protein [Nicotiana sylvestris]|uniref:uncharacterized protein n=1 Tax=Nicotiana sylvestris TaxID=4096 RepID=UPI00388CD6DA